MELWLCCVLKERLELVLLVFLEDVGVCLCIDLLC